MAYQIKDIEGFPGYRVDTNGEVWSCRSRNGRGDLKSVYRKLKACLKGNGGGKHYLGYILCRPGEKKEKHKHRLLAEAFLPNHQNLPWVRHLNDNCLDNRLENLAWGDQFDNAADSIRNGKQVRGESVGNHKLKEKEVLEIKKLAARGGTDRGLARKYAVDPKLIWLIRRGLVWKHILIN